MLQVHALDPSTHLFYLLTSVAAALISPHENLKSADTAERDREAIVLVYERNMSAELLPGCCWH